jgi:hypothetical protein
MHTDCDHPKQLFPPYSAIFEFSFEVIMLSLALKVFQFYILLYQAVYFYVA